MSDNSTSSLAAYEIQQLKEIITELKTLIGIVEESRDKARRSERVANTAVLRILHYLPELERTHPEVAERLSELIHADV